MSVISVLVDADAVTCSDDQHISGVQQEQDQPKDTTLWHRDIYPPFDTLRNPPRSVVSTLMFNPPFSKS